MQLACYDAVFSGDLPLTTPENAAELLRLHYGIEASLRELPGELDLNYLVQSTTGERYVCKLMHTGCDTASVHFQCAALQHLQNSSLNLPRVVRSRSDRDMEMVEVAGQRRVLWLLRFCPGILLAHYRPHTATLQESFGRVMAQLAVELQAFRHPAMHRDHRWELTRADQALAMVDDVPAAGRKEVRAALENFCAAVAPLLPALPAGVIHNDANDYNVVVEPGGAGAVVTGLFDFGDMSWQPLICDVAIALAYLILDQPDPLSVCANFLRGYHALRPPQADELALLFDLIRTRLAVSLAVSSHRQLAEPDDPYITISQAPARDALSRLAGIPPKFAECVFRRACSLPALPRLDAVHEHLHGIAAAAAPVIAMEQSHHVIDLSVSSLMLGADPDNGGLAPLTRLIEADMSAAGVKVAYGRYAEARGIYTADSFGASDAYPTAERRTEHIGLDIFCAPHTPVYTPLDATVECIANNLLPLDYGPLVILRHVTPAGDPFFTLYGHLNLASIGGLEPGASLSRGEGFATVGESAENGGWTPHLHFQIILDLLQLGAHFPGVVAPTHAAVWRQLCPNPALLLAGADPAALDGSADSQQLLARRQRLLSPALRLSYERPLHIVRGFRQFLYDSSARAYLDAYNNVAHVGHSHPRVVSAVQRQVALLNTNTRYLHENILDYAERLTATLPAELSACLFVNSASEANELALRLARGFTGRRDMCVMAAAYHGNTCSLTELSPYKYDGPGGNGRPDWVHEVPLADDYRGPFRRGDPLAGSKYAQAMAAVIDRAEGDGRRIAAFIAETLPSVGGQIVLPPGFLREAYRVTRERGGLCIADEVQVGFGRLGSSFWGFESENVIPDIVVLGKPIANGFPLGAVITRADIAASLDNGMEFFSTYGGNPVACAAGIAVLEVLAEENLQANALALGETLLRGLRDLKATHSLVGDARGRGLFLGLELVRDQKTLEPADHETAYVVNRLRDHQILTGSDGPYHNVIKIRPPMVVTAEDVSVLLQTLDKVLGETPLQAGQYR
jgi:4-aminobutyrate aminotransferase-like enzyme/Ser/Thr protein kinase RdoA (MazF antagonist)